MTLEPLLHASTAIQFHVVTVVTAAIIGAHMLWARKGTPRHRISGRVWIVLMAMTALSTFFIHEINLFYGFSPIHLLSVVVLVSVVEVVRSARRRDFVRHKRVVKALYFGAIGIAGLFTLMPGRIMNTSVFGPGAGTVHVAIMPLLIGLFSALAVAACAVAVTRFRRRAV
ncbi:DUF2306 domain-containing protein [Hoeflea sp. G2-23]|uniref:DUF2306 domain-containing protein n=1 Tax=Hoeflea algicola TaxID=2983763 RepID=A0ABT3Z859_9HYPH|nr:DUF2306 domain-containing protein [Hoeflea algicola]MCY0147955.1 DUF2306 domain-containing protein [Hoeflea algicola]